MHTKRIYYAALEVERDAACYTMGEPMPEVFTTGWDGEVEEYLHYCDPVIVPIHAIYPDDLDGGIADHICLVKNRVTRPYVRSATPGQCNGASMWAERTAKQEHGVLSLNFARWKRKSCLTSYHDRRIK